MKSDFYFRHDLYTKDDDKICKLTNDLGAAGYGLYWATVEALYLCETHQICRLELINNLSRRFMTFEDGVPSVPAEIGEFVNYVFSDNCQLFEVDGDCLYSNRILESCKMVSEFIEKQRKNGEKGGRPKTQTKPKENPSLLEEKTQALTQKKAYNQDQDQDQDQNNNITMSSTSKTEVSDHHEKEEVYISFPTNKTGEEYHVTKKYVEEKKALFPALDIEQEFRSMRNWLIDNPSNRKTMRGMTAFIGNWLSRSQDGAFRIRDNKHPQNRFTNLREKLESQENEYGGFDL